MDESYKQYWAKGCQHRRIYTISLQAYDGAGLYWLVKADCVQFFFQLYVQWYLLGSLKSAMLGVFIPQKLSNITKQVFSFLVYYLLPSSTTLLNKVHSPVPGISILLWSQRKHFIFYPRIQPRLPCTFTLLSLSSFWNDFIQLLLLEILLTLSISLTMFCPKAIFLTKEL